MADKVIEFVFKSIEFENTTIRREEGRGPLLSSESVIIKGEWQLSGNNNSFQMDELAYLTPEEQGQLSDLLLRIESRLHTGLLKNIINPKLRHRGF
jgi:hypothetical protein